jgi:hypothetical protein
MLTGWTTKRILITARTYPVPARKSIEVSCTGGVTDDGKWIRLFPVPYRFLDDDKRFKKYQWINLSVAKATSDARPESFHLNIASINIESTIDTAHEWRARRDIVRPLMRPSMCEIQRERAANGSPTLGIFKPKEIKRLLIEKTTPEWTEEQATILRQVLLFEKMPAKRLEKIPFNFKYQFSCDDSDCAGHEMICTDWEMGASYRAWRNVYGADWEGKFRQKYEDEMINRFDTHFYVGTIHQHPGSWIIIGLFYPPPRADKDLFDL